MLILHLVHWIAKSIIDTLKNYVRMHDHLPWKGKYFIHLLQNTQQWCGVVYELNPTFFNFNGGFLHYVTHSNKHFLHGGKRIWKSVRILLFFNIGGGVIRYHKPKDINKPWLFRMIFISLFINRFIVINVQIGRVHKHGNKTSMIRSIPCLTILNDIFFNEINTCKKNDNLMFAQVSTQCPFICATNILGERKWDLICYIQMVLAPYHPCMASFVRIIYPMGDMGVKDQCGLLNAQLHNVFHNLVFYKPMFFHFSHVHVVSYNRCCESPH